MRQIELNIIGGCSSTAMQVPMDGSGPPPGGSVSKRDEVRESALRTSDFGLSRSGLAMATIPDPNRGKWSQMLARTPAVRLAVSIACAVFVSGVSLSPAAAQAIDHLGVPGPIQFDGNSYKLVWSSRPSPGYTKQEYLPSDQRIGSYTQMLMVETMTGDLTVMDAVRAQIDMLKKRKATDPLVNMNVIQNTQAGEALLDFIVSSKDPKGENVVEWNAYRYAPLKGAADKSGVLLFAISHRAYGNDSAKSFLGQLKNRRAAQITALTKAAMPSVGGRP